MPRHKRRNIPQMVQVACHIAHAERAGADFDQKLAGSGLRDGQVVLDDDGFAVLRLSVSPGIVRVAFGQGDGTSSTTAPRMLFGCSDGAMVVCKQSTDSRQGMESVLSMYGCYVLLAVQSYTPSLSLIRNSHVSATTNGTPTTHGFDFEIDSLCTGFSRCRCFGGAEEIYMLDGIDLTTTGAKGLYSRIPTHFTACTRFVAMVAFT